MTVDLFFAMLAYAFAMSATPGPNTLMLLASGVNFGYRPTVPHQLGIILGLASMLALVGAGLGAAILSIPPLLIGMKAASIAYMLYLAWKIAGSGPPSTGTAQGARPMTFYEAALFQWVNPKAWAMALSGVAGYTRPEAYLLTLGVFVAVLLTISFPVTSAWVVAGVKLRAVLQSPRALRAFNWTMAALLVASLWPIARDLLP
jgi:threonine/homoserine/homoserine lactone efflux protein